MVVNIINSKVLKNTLFLYFRMIVIMLMTFYTSRVVLDVLGVDDFGIYNIVGGIVLFFSFLNTAMTTSTQRFLNIELGNNNIDGVQQVFSMSITIHFIIVIFVLLIAETIGLWVVKEIIKVPPDREDAAYYVYHISVLTFCVQILRVPFNASIIAHEKMSFYAYVSVLEVVLKLLVVFLLMFSSFDKLILYSILLFVVTIIINVVYNYYCRSKFSYCRYRFFREFSSYKKILSFSGWSLFGNISNVSAHYGINVLLNNFFGVAMNAATGIANQISHAIYSFVSNFQIAFNPYLTKMYAKGDLVNLKYKIVQISRLSFFLYLIFSIPLFFCIDFILSKWLTVVPNYTDVFARLILIFLAIDAIAAPLWITAQAIGNIRKYQLIVGLVTLFNLPISYIALNFMENPGIVWIIRIIFNFFLLLYRMFYIQINLGLPGTFFLKNVIRDILKVLFLSSIVPVIFYINIGEMNWCSFLLFCALTTLSSFLIIYSLGLSKSEKKMVVDLIKKVKKNVE